MGGGHVDLRGVAPRLEREGVFDGGVERERELAVRLLEVRVEVVVAVETDVLANDGLQVGVHVEDGQHAVEATRAQRGRETN